MGVDLDDDDVARALALLTVRQREALYLVCIRRQTTRQAARVLGVSHVAVHKILRRAKDRLIRAMLDRRMTAMTLGEMLDSSPGGWRAGPA